MRGTGIVALFLVRLSNGCRSKYIQLILMTIRYYETIKNIRGNGNPNTQLRFD